MQKIEKVGIVGAGTMGRGIAQVCAMAGYTTILNDISEDTLSKAHKQIVRNLAKGVEKGKVSTEVQELALENLSLSQDLTGSISDADMVIEAVPEIMELKKSLLNTIDEYTPEHCIIGTNTSSLSITELAESTSDASRVIGMHFFNPVHIMQLLEIVYAPDLTGNDVASVGFVHKVCAASTIDMRYYAIVVIFDKRNVACIGTRPEICRSSIFEDVIVGPTINRNIETTIVVVI